jgi:hypothetical protein
MMTKKLMSSLLVSGALALFSQMSWSMDGGDSPDAVTPPEDNPRTLLQQRLDEVKGATTDSLVDIFRELIVQKAEEEERLYPPLSFVQRWSDAFLKEFFGDISKDSHLIVTAGLEVVEENFASKIAQQKEEFTGLWVSRFGRAFEARDSGLLKFIVGQGGKAVVDVWLEQVQGGLEDYQIRILSGILFGFANNKQVDVTAAFNVFGRKEGTPAQARFEFFTDALQEGNLKFAGAILDLLGNSKTKPFETRITQLGHEAMASATQGKKGVELINAKKKVESAVHECTMALATFYVRRTQENLDKLKEGYEKILSFLETNEVVLDDL